MGILAEDTLAAEMTSRFSELKRTLAALRPIVNSHIGRGVRGVVDRQPDHGVGSRGGDVGFGCMEQAFRRQEKRACASKSYVFFFFFIFGFFFFTLFTFRFFFGFDFFGFERAGSGNLNGSSHGLGLPDEEQDRQQREGQK
jgi:hypothetical protein